MDVDTLINTIYMENEMHLDYMENMNGGDCDCVIHNALTVIGLYNE